MAELKRLERVSTTVEHTAIRPDRSAIAGADEFAHTLGVIADKAINEYQRDVQVEAGEYGAVETAETGKLNLRKDDTLAAAAYNRAARDTYANQIENEARTKADALFDENRHDPAALQAAFANYETGIINGLKETDDTMVGPFKNMFARATASYLRSSTDEHRKVVMASSTAAVNENLQALQQNVTNRALVSANYVDDMVEFTLDREQFLKGLISTGPQQGFKMGDVDYLPDAKRSGARTTAEIQAAMQNFDYQVRRSSITGAFEAADKKSNGKTFLLKLMNDRKLLTYFSPEQKDDLERDLTAQFNRMESLRKADEVSIGDSVRSAMKVLDAGGMPANFKQIDGMVKGSKYEADWFMAVEQQKVTATLSKSRQQDIAAFVDHLENKKSTGTFSEYELGLLSKAKSIQTQVTTMLETDPMRLAIHQGVVPEPPPLLDKDGNVDPVSASTLKESAAKVSAYYGRPAAPMTGPQIDAFAAYNSKQIASVRAGNMGALSFAFGEYAAPVMQQLNKKGYSGDAFVGSTFIEAGRPSAGLMSGPDVATAYYEGADIIAPPGDLKSPLDVPKQQFDADLADKLGTVYFENPQARAGLNDAVFKIYASLSAKDKDYKQAIPDPDRMNTAIRQVLGGDLIRFDQPGWFDSYKAVLTPPFRGATTDDWNGWWGGISGAEIKAAGGMPGYTDDAAAELIRERGTPVEVGQGVYLVTIKGFDSGPAKAASGQPLTLRFPVDKYIKVK